MKTPQDRICRSIHAAVKSARASSRAAEKRLESLLYCASGDKAYWTIEIKRLMECSAGYSVNAADLCKELIKEL